MKKQRRIDFGLHMVSEPDEYNGECFVVFEEPYDNNGKLKTYDLTIGVFDDLEIAKDYSKSFSESHVSLYSEYITGNYNYL